MQKMQTRDILNTLSIILRLRNTINVNGLLYGIRRLPIIGKLISDRIYGIRFIKILALIHSFNTEIFKAFAGKLFFLLVIFLGSGAVSSFNGYDQSTVFLYAFLIYSIFDVFMVNFFTVSTEVEYGVFMLGMDAKKYISAMYVYRALTVFLGYTFFGLPFAFIAGVPWYIAFLMPLAGVGFKSLNLGAMMAVYSSKISHGHMFDRKGRRVPFADQNACVLLGFAVMTTGLIAAPLVIIDNLFLIPALGVVIAVLINIPALLLVKKFPYGLYRTALFAEKSRKELVKRSVKKSIKTVSVAQITETEGITSGAKGYRFLNELFIKRHRKLLWGTVNGIMVSTAIAVILASVVLYLEIYEFHGDPSETLVRGLFTAKLSGVPFVLYFINRGSQISQTMFANCDSSLLMFGFYKTPKSILTMFRLRIESMIRLNLPPALLIAVYAVAVLAFTGGEDYRFQYLFTFLSIILTMIFFSVHHLAVYYLMQPYTSELKIKSKSYTLVSAAVYFVCWILFNNNVSAEIFAPAAAGFTVLYIIVACVLVYRFSPKTFRIK
ncbi:MAG: hypothetical protein J6Z43_03775 [Clostridiales bacterium]|nr:hypothetical protein [Clostridiales bacterium]